MNCVVTREVIVLLGIFVFFGVRISILEIKDNIQFPSWRTDNSDIILSRHGYWYGSYFCNEQAFWINMARCEWSLYLTGKQNFRYTLNRLCLTMPSRQCRYRAPYYLLSVWHYICPADFHAKHYMRLFGLYFNIVTEILSTLPYSMQK